MYEPKHNTAASSFGPAGVEMIKTCGPVYKRAALRYHADLLRTDGSHGETVVMAGRKDGIHLEQEGHDALAGLLCRKLEEMEAEMQQVGWSNLE